MSMSGEWSVSDAGSKNGTTVNGTRLAPRELVEVTNGDRVTFGSIETLFLDAGTIWRLIRRV
jgi:pSer/pThr/pTyr-binding forkhead associated (FHA) protein